MLGFGLSPFVKDGNGNVVGLSSTGILMPTQENPYRMLFGGVVLTSFDELSGLLAGLFFRGHALHVSELVGFHNPVFTGHSVYSVFQVIDVKLGFALIYGRVYSQPLGVKPVDATAMDKVSYDGYAVCAMVDSETKKIIRESMPILALPDGWISSEILEIGQEYFALQRRLAKAKRL
jgi:hypothetical protein